MPPPCLDQDLDLGQRVEDLAVEKISRLSSSSRSDLLNDSQ